MQAMVLAAGYGTRLKPFSLCRPKPLFPILNTPLLLATLERLQHSGFTTQALNCCHLSEQIVAATQHVPGLIIQEEQSILGTGGGIRQMLPKISAEPLLVTNGDIYHSIDFQTIYEQHCSSDAPISLVLHNYPRFNNVNVSGNTIVGFGKTSRGSSDQLAYTGIQIVEPAILKGIQPGVYSCIIEYYRSLLADGVQLNAIIIDDCFWTDMGTPADYLQLHEDLLIGNAPVWAELEAKNIEPFFSSDQAVIDQSCRFADWACIGRARVGRDVVVKRSVVWDDAQINDGTEISEAIIIPEMYKSPGY